MFRRLTLPVVLVLTLVVSVTQAWRTDAQSDPDLAVPTSYTAAATPVASVRRAPQWLREPTSDALLVTALNQVIARSPVDTCLVVRHGDQVVFEHNPTKPLVPASTTKLVTAFAALDLLGADGRLTTTMSAARGPSPTGEIESDLFVIGGGNPVLSTADFASRYERPQLYTDIGALVDALVDAGVTSIRGGIVGDESRYDQQRFVETWDPSFVAANESGPLSALAVNDGYSSFPTVKFPVALVRSPDPALLAADLIRDALIARGIPVGSPARSGAAPPGLATVATVDIAVEDVIHEMLSESDNYAAELLTKELGVQVRGTGSTEAGVAVARQATLEAGLPMDGVSLLDGSGLDRANALTCDHLSRLLSLAGPDSALADGLAVAGQTGTLSLRLVGTTAAGRVRAKTGSLRNSRALAGFADSAVFGESETLTFAYIANQDDLDIVEVGDVQDQLSVDLVAYPGGPSLTALGPR